MITISWSALIAICAAVITVSGAVGAVVKFITFLRKPETKQNQEIADLMRRMSAVEEKLSTDKQRLDDLETGLKYTLESLFALLSHALDGNDVEGLKTAKAHLNDYLIKKVEK
jgi:hypothetical protein